MPDGKTHVHVLDVGQGDGIFIVGPQNQQILIDGGPDLSALGQIGKRMSFFDRSIDLLVLSHPHLDHIAAFPEILERYQVKSMMLTGVANDLSAYEQTLTLLKEQQIPVIVADPQKDIDMGGGLLLDVLWPPPMYFGKEMKGDLNDSSVVIKLMFGEDSMLLAGDMEEIEEEELLASGTNVDSDILKVAHHGSRSSTSTGFLLAVSPEMAVISAGRDNSFNHPHPWTIDRLRHFGIPVRATLWEGTISIEMDGNND